MNIHFPKNSVLLVSCIIAGCFITTGVSAQDYNEIFKTEKYINPGDSNNLFFRIENTNFFKNNEYFGRNEEGFTDLGVMLKPEFVYHPSKNTRLEAGMHLLKFSGRNDFMQAYPVFSFQAGICKGLDILLGSLHSGYNHELIEPIYKPERHFEHNYENGIQIMTNLKRFKSDLWIDWEKFIFPGDTFKEEFTIGTSDKIILTNPESDFIISVPFQGVASHKGGQITSDSSHMQSVVDGGGGLSLEYKCKTKWVNSYGINSYFLQYADVSPTPGDDVRYVQGYGSYSNVWINSVYFNLYAGYWHGKFFMAPRGEELFQSVSSKEGSDARTPVNQIVFTKFGLKKEVYKDVFVELRFEGYYELYDKNFDYSYGLHIVFNRNFFLKKI